MFAPVLDNEFAREVRAGLTRSGQKTLPCRYLYDSVGSALFEAITCLDEYGLTRADARLMTAHADAVIAAMPGPSAVAELGSGNGIKTRPILESLRRRERVVYYPIDLSTTALAKCSLELGPLGTVAPIEKSYLEGMCEVVARRAAGQTLLVLFLGSTIGNFEPEAAIDFVYALRSQLQAGDALLLGTDLVKPVDVMRAAYDDAAGVTAAFNLNLLARINRELDADFDLRRFEHQVRYNREAQRIEMHLQSLMNQTVRVGKAGLEVDFGGGETILTEVCHKFRAHQIGVLARVCGFRVEQQWVDEKWPFAESLLRVV
ncbi:MAG TPA: L-histidine N(alpha)-methyltransferase [Bryobacteraceae bacterium]|nr:L-histidine N(alpha)-methyltransferase [Bryobacteraceae bacterium]